MPSLFTVSFFTDVYSFMRDVSVYIVVVIVVVAVAFDGTVSTYMHIFKVKNSRIFRSPRMGFADEGWDSRNCSVEISLSKSSAFYSSPFNWKFVFLDSCITWNVPSINVFAALACCSGRGFPLFPSPYRTLSHLYIQYNTIQYNTIQYNTIQYNTIQYNTIQYNTIQYNTLHYTTLHYTTIQYSTILQYNIQ